MKQEDRTIDDYLMSLQQKIVPIHKPTPLINIFLAEESEGEGEVSVHEIHDHHPPAKEFTLIDNEIVCNQETIIHEQQVQEVEHEKQFNIQPSPLANKNKKNRLFEVRKRRNQKSSIRHRRNRYNYEIRRPLQIPVTAAKQRLRTIPIAYL